MTKNFLQSKTFIGIIVMISGIVLQSFGIDVDLTGTTDGVTLSEALIIVGTIASTLGARFATKPVTIFGKTYGEDLAKNPAAQAPTQDV